MSDAQVTTTRAQNYTDWYQQVIAAADLAETSDVRGCMVIKPWGYALWEHIQRGLDGMFKATGHVNAYFPLFIPLSYFQREAEHVEGFAKECAVVTHHRLEDRGGRLVPAGELEEPLVVRPTSETIIGASFARWVQSYRDLPLLINQWCNVVRWEMRTRLFLRTAEFLWQEGHTAHATEQDAVEETMKMLGVYAEFAEQWMAIPVVQGEKTAGQRFPGAVNTYCIEAMMQDRKALQAGTSHFLGQNFAKTCGIKFQDQSATVQHAWTTSWGVSTRLIGGMIMTHADDTGMKVPPRLAPYQIVIIPAVRKPEDRERVMTYCRALQRDLAAQTYAGEPVRVHVDPRDMTSSDMSWDWIKRGAPVRLEVGPRDIDKDSVFMGRRDLGPKEKRGVPRGEIVATAGKLLEEIQTGMFERARAFRAEHTRTVDTEADFRAFFTGPTVAENQPAPIFGGFAMTHFGGDPALEKRIQEELGVTVRCIPLGPGEPGTCPFTGQPSPRRVVWARAY